MSALKERWNIQCSFLEHRHIWNNESSWKFIPHGFDVHHINGNRLDNRIENLACIPHDIHAQIHWDYEKLNNIIRARS